jgi:hypothetical protein
MINQIKVVEISANVSGECIQVRLSDGLLIVLATREVVEAVRRVLLPQTVTPIPAVSAADPRTGPSSADRERQAMRVSAELYLASMNIASRAKTGSQL